MITEEMASRRRKLTKLFMDANITLGQAKELKQILLTEGNVALQERDYVALYAILHWIHAADDLIKRGVNIFGFRDCIRSIDN